MSEITEDDVERAARAILGVRFGADAAAFFEPVPDDFPQATEARTAFARRVDEAYAEARAALTAAFASRPSQGGEWVMVPREPTEAMLAAGSMRTGEQYRAMLSASPSPYGVEGWQDISTAPKNGTEFQSWVCDADGRGFWEPRSRFDPHTEAFQMFGRVDYDEDGWDTYPHLTATHWRPLPAPPSLTKDQSNG